MSGPSPERNPYGDGAVGFLVQDPATEAWHWSVRWPAHRCRDHRCTIRPTRQTYRSGHAPTRREATEAADAAHGKGRPAPGEGQAIP